VRDKDIRLVLKNEFARKYARDNSTLVLDELGICHGAARLDLAVVNHLLHGYEIKSDVDSLKRLPDQIQIFNSVVDRMTLVVGYRHAYSALDMVPDWWGVRLADQNAENNETVLKTARLPRDNPAVDVNAVVALLWREEALGILEEMGLADGVRSKNRVAIYQRLVQMTEPKYLCIKVRQQLKDRKGWRADVQQMSCGG